MTNFKLYRTEGVFLLCEAAPKSKQICFVLWRTFIAERRCQDMIVANDRLGAPPLPSTSFPSIKSASSSITIKYSIHRPLCPHTTSIYNLLTPARRSKSPLSLLASAHLLYLHQPSACHISASQPLRSPSSVAHQTHTYAPLSRAELRATTHLQSPDLDAT